MSLLVICYLMSALPGNLLWALTDEKTFLNEVIKFLEQRDQMHLICHQICSCDIKSTCAITTSGTFSLWPKNEKRGLRYWEQQIKSSVRSFLINSCYYSSAVRV